MSQSPASASATLIAGRPGLDVLRAAVQTTVLGASSLASFHPAVRRRANRGPVTLFEGGTPADEAGPGASYAFVFGPTPPDRFFELAEDFYGAPNACSVTVEVEVATELDQALHQRGWQLDEEEPALVMWAPPTAIPNPPAGLTIRRVTDAAILADFCTVSRTGPRWIPSVQAATAPGVAIFVGYVDGQPVASSRMARVTAAGRSESLADTLGGTEPNQGEDAAAATACGPDGRSLSVADINGVRVLPEFRRRGFGTALTWATVAEAARLGCHAAVLTSTEMGYAVYVRMGFHPVCTLRTYVPPPLTPSTTIRRHARRAYHVQTGLAGRRHHSRRVVWGVPVVGAPRVLDGSARLN